MFYLYRVEIAVIKTLIKVLWVFPVQKNKIMFISYSGDYSDSPKYIYKKFVCSGIPYEYVWATNSKSIDEDEIRPIKKVRHGTFKYIKEICTSKIIITNNFLNTYIPRRPKQLIVNTWHGGSPLKTVGMVNENISKFDMFFYKEHAKKYNLYISSSDFMTKEVFRKSFGYKGPIVNCGLPRNAILYRDHTEAKQKISEYFNITIDNGNGVILYAPTFRGGAKDAGFIPSSMQFSISRCIESLERTFNKRFKLLFRSHYFSDNLPSDCILAGDYPDMQELMAAADIMITDYSSCMGDMCLMNKPVFLYVPDLESYSSEQGFYWDIYSLPFPVAKDENELIDAIEKFDRYVYLLGVNKYLKRLGSYEGPDMDIRFTEILYERMKKDRPNE